MTNDNAIGSPESSIGHKLRSIRWPFVLLLCITAGIGVAMLYSAGNGSFHPWASRHAVRFCVGLLIMIAVALVDIRIWLRYAYVFYMVVLALLGVVEFSGDIGMGAQRWIDLGFINLQPSEVMKVALVLALARYFHGYSLEDIRRIGRLVPPLFLVAAPSALVLRQPDLGTALMLILAAGIVFFAAGVRIWKFGVFAFLALAGTPVVWQFLRPYQQQRVLTFLDPERDPLGAGYHIIQSKIALGSGGLTGKGFLKGSQAHLNFLPEKQTDFIFTVLAEEFGMIGGLVLLGLYTLILAYGFAIALRSRSQFGRLVGLGVTATFFLYVFVNVAMVMGVIPVVGAPLPLISYGGTAMMTLMVSFGLLMGVDIHRNMTIGR